MVSTSRLERTPNLALIVDTVCGGENKNQDGDDSDQYHHLQRTQNQTPLRSKEKLEALEKQVTRIGRDQTHLLAIQNKQNPSTKGSSGIIST